MKLRTLGAVTATLLAVSACSSHPPTSASSSVVPTPSASPSALAPVPAPSFATAADKAAYLNTSEKTILADMYVPIATYFVDYLEPVRVERVGDGVYMTGGSLAKPTLLHTLAGPETELVFADITYADAASPSSSFCYQVTNPGDTAGLPATYSYSAASGLLEGACATT